MLKIWGRTNSSNVQKVMWCVGELGLPHERVDAGGAFGGLAEPAYRAMNPNGRIPTVDDYGVILFESNAICRHLARKHRALMPRALADQARVDMWMDWQQTEAMAALTPVFWGLVRTPPEKRDMAAIETGKANTIQKMQILDAALADHLYVVGNSFTVADIPLGVVAYRYGLLIPEAPPLKNVARWYASLLERPAFRTHVADIPLT